MRKKRLVIMFVCFPVGAVIASVLLVILLKWVPITTTPLMIKRNLGRDQHWVRLEDISSPMISAVICTEDQRFFSHNGFDYKSIAKMYSDYRYADGNLRGCSTISQQTAKNCFTFCSHTFLRKAVEAYFTVLIEIIWGKNRILEVYLNIAEWGPGLYGVEAASRKYYHIHARDLTASDASSLACCLPNPLARNPEWVNVHMAMRRSQVAQEISCSRER